MSSAEVTRAALEGLAALVVAGFLARQALTIERDRERGRRWRHPNSDLPRMEAPSDIWDEENAHYADTGVSWRFTDKGTLFPTELGQRAVTTDSDEPRDAWVYGFGPGKNAAHSGNEALRYEQRARHAKLGGHDQLGAYYDKAAAMSGAF